MPAQKKPRLSLALEKALDQFYKHSCLDAKYNVFLGMYLLDSSHSVMTHSILHNIIIHIYTLSVNVSYCIVVINKLLILAGR